MKKKALVFSAGLLFVFSFTAVSVIAEKKTQKGKTKAEDASEKEFPWDKGPAEISVSKYPPEQQKNYKNFATKCSKCHALAVTINAPYALPEEWEECVKRMQKKKRSGLDPKSAKKITEFLIYDSSVRKKDLIEEKRKEQEAQGQGKEAETEKKNAP